MGVIQAYDLPLGVMGHLTSYKELVADALGILVLGGSRQPGGTFGFVHGRDTKLDLCRSSLRDKLVVAG